MTTAARRSRAGTDPDRHEAVLHESPDDLARRLAPRIRVALAESAVVVAVLAPDHEQALRATLGPRGADVEFGDPVRVHAVPAFTVAGRLARTSRRARRFGGRSLVITQQLPDLPDCEPAHWARLDIALNVAIAGLPITVLCPCTDPQLVQARSHHPVITGPTGSVPSADYRSPHDAVLDFPLPPAPDLGPPTVEQGFTATGLSSLRHLVGSVATQAGLPSDGVADLVLAVNELASNSVEHGPGSGVLRIWDTPTALVAEVVDHGGGLHAPFPGLVLPPPEGARGRGLWLAAELCDVLEVWSDAAGTVSRVQMSR